MAIKKYLKIKYVLGIVAIIFFAWILFHGGPNQKNFKTYKIEKKTIKSEVSASGNIDPIAKSTLHFAVSGKVAYLPVSEGDHVQKGQVIASLDGEQYQIALRQAQQDVAAADAQLVKVYDDISHRNGIESFDQKITRTTAEANKNKAFDAQKEAERELRSTTILAPVGGVVTNVLVNSGDQVLPTTDIAKIVDNSGISFRAEVDETEISKIEVGQTAKVALDAYPDETQNSSVASIAQSSITTSTGATAYEVSLGVPNTDKYKVGMNGEAKILTKEIDDTVVVPLEAMVEDNSVWVKAGSSYSKRTVKKGLSSDTEVEITEGLSAGNEILTSGFAEIDKKSLFDKIFRR